MRRLPSALVALCGTSLLLGAVELRVFQAEMSSSFGTVPGKVLLHPDTFTFLDEERAESSFAVLRSEISAVNNQNEMVVVQLTEPVKDRVGTTTRLSLRLASPTEAASLAGWFAEAPQSAQEGRSGLESAQGPMAPEAGTYQVIHKRFFGDTTGRLMITSDRLIYESINNADASRRWEYKDIRELKLRNPYSIMVKPFAGDTYNFEITGSGMNTDVFSDLVNRVTRARTQR